MKQQLGLILVMSGVALASGGAYGFTNNTTLINPPLIDATNVVNNGIISTFNASFGTELYDTQNTRTFMNGLSGTMDGSPGFRFDYLPFPGNGFRFPSFGFTNRGSIFATRNILINSTNIVSRNNALLSVDRGGRIRMEGRNVDLFNGRIRAGESSTRFNATEGSTTFIINNIPFFTSLSNSVDEYWGAGDGGTIDLPFMSIGGVTDNHIVTNRSGFLLSTFLNINPETGTTGIPGYSLYTTNTFVPTGNNNWRASVVLVLIQTNFPGTPATRVFLPVATNSNNFFMYEPVIEWSVQDVDILTGQAINRYLYFTDESGIRARPNVGNLVNLTCSQSIDRPGRWRPSAYSLVRTDFPFQVPGFEAPPQLWDPSIMFLGTATFLNPRHRTNLADNVYSAYQFTLTPRDLGGGDVGGGFGQEELFDPTNSPARIEIFADQLNLGFTKMRAENLITIRATNIVNSFGAELQAQNISVELMSPAGSATVSNMFPTSVSRLNGTVSAWSGIFQNGIFVTNTAPFLGAPILLGSNLVEATYHVLVVDVANINTFILNPVTGLVGLTTNQPVGVENFRIRAPEFVLADDIIVNKNLLIESSTMIIPTNGSLGVGGINLDISVTNFPNLKYLTNLGTISVPQTGNFGFDQPGAYSNIVNWGTIAGGAFQFRSDYFQNTNIISGGFGPILIQAKTNQLFGGTLFAGSNIELYGDDLVVNNSAMTSLGSLNFDITQRLDDQGVTNDWNVRAGFSLNSKPIKGDLLSTRLTSFGPTNFNVLHFWAGEDRGDNPDGYANNTAIGRVVLDGELNSRFIFAGTGDSNAMYIDYLELLNHATNFATAIFVQPNLTIYVADSNVPVDKITNAHGGRIVWVSPTTRAGPMVVVPVSISQTTTMTSQEYRALLPGNQDYDFDGIQNSEDETPLSGFTLSEIRVVNLPPLTTFISWQAIGGVSYVVEYKTSVEAENWLQLGTFSSPDSRKLTVGDPVPLVGQRYYRVRYTRPGS